MNMILYSNKNKMLHIVGYSKGTLVWGRPADIGLVAFILLENSNIVLSRRRGSRSLRRVLYQ